MTSLVDVLDRPQPAAAELSLACDRIVLRNRIAAGTVHIAGGKIVEIAEDSFAPDAITLEGGILLPGIVDIHTDHLEKHVFPRSHVRWDMMPAVLAHDAQMIGAGVTTVFDSLCVGASLKQPERRDILKPMIDALEAAKTAGMLKADHLVHLRCEITDAETPRMVTEEIHRPIVRVASVMDHTPGDRQSPDVNVYRARMLKATEMTEAELDAAIEEMMERAARVSADVRAAVIDTVNAHGLPLLSHDDATPEQVGQAAAEGVTVSEFPTTLDAARTARVYGMQTVAGAPNILRGGSQSGNVAVADLLAEGLVDMLASDYVPRSLLDALFRLADDPEVPLDLPAAARMVTAAPAEAAGLGDRGEITTGRRADLLHISVVGGQPVLRAVYVAGQRVA